MEKKIKAKDESVKYYFDIDQGTGEWLKARAGIVTASVMCKILTPKLKVADNETSRSFIYEMIAQRVTGNIEEIRETFDMQRGTVEEIYARDMYSDNYSPVKECGFITNSGLGDFILGFSPDGLVGYDGIIEIKSRLQKFQIKTILSDEVPEEYIFQCQSGLLASQREWCDFIQYSNGMPMFVKRMHPCIAFKAAAIEALEETEKKIKQGVEDYKNKSKLFHTAERREIEEFMILAS